MLDIIVTIAYNTIRNHGQVTPLSTQHLTGKKSNNCLMWSVLCQGERTWFTVIALKILQVVWKKRDSRSVVLVALGLHQEWTQY